MEQTKYEWEVQEIDIVFDGPPGPESGRFVEVERNGASVSVGQWVQRKDGLWALRLRVVVGGKNGEA